jgi:hypothetical protein
MNLGIGVIGTGIMGADPVETITAALSGAENSKAALSFSTNSS